MLHKVINHPDLLRMYCQRNMIAVQDEVDLSEIGRRLSLSTKRETINAGSSSNDTNQSTLSFKPVKQDIPQDRMSAKEEHSPKTQHSHAGFANMNTIPNSRLTEEEELKQRQRAVADIFGLDLPISVRRMKPLLPKENKKGKNKPQLELQNLEELGDETGEESKSIKDYSWVLPVLLNEYQLHVAAHSSKMMFLLKLLEEVFRRDEKVLVFSQFNETLTVIESILTRTDLVVNAKGKMRKLKPHVDYSRLDGTMSNSDRERLIRAFNAPGSTRKLFLISTRAGGLGINLTSATRVVLFDCCFDPSNDTQSIFRAYRYGQTKPVFVYRLIGAGTVEEAIWKKCMAKGWLFKRVIDDKTPVRLLTAEDLNLYAFDQSSESVVSSELDPNVFEDDRVLLGICESSEFEKMIQKVEEVCRWDVPRDMV